ncbi:MAG: hypothetical protein JWQ40_3230 [Segetibacter sp.]|nr:hypothetical protein [Segetibacter sp.]
MFSTDFNYKNSSYTALVTISGHHNDCTITIQVTDPSLHNFLPGGKVTLDTEKRILKGENKCTPDKDLVDAILAAVQKHENNKPLRDNWN